MPDRAQHEQRAYDNEQFAIHRLDERVEVDRSWIVAALFYAAVHWVEAYFAEGNRHSKSHRGREQMIIADPYLGVGFYRVYRALEDRSQDARYELRVFSVAEVNDLRHQELAAIKRDIRKLLP